MLEVGCWKFTKYLITLAFDCSGGVLYRDNLVRLVVDVPDLAKNREWMKRFKKRWKTRLEQLELWMVSYRIDVD